MSHQKFSILSKIFSKYFNKEEEGDVLLLQVVPIHLLLAFVLPSVFGADPAVKLASTILAREPLLLLAHYEPAAVSPLKGDGLGVQVLMAELFLWDLPPPATPMAVATVTAAVVL